MKTYSIPRQIWRAFYPFLICVGLAFIVPLVASMAFSVSLTIEAAGSGVDLPDMELISKQIEAFITDNTMLFQLVANAIAIFIFALMWRKIRAKLPRYEANRINILTAGLTILCFAGLNYLLVSIFSITDITRFFPSYEAHAELLLGGGFLIRIIGLGLLAPLVEELVCRGIIFNRLGSWMPTWAAALVSSALFAVMHFNLFQLLYTFVVGLAFCAVYIRFRNLGVAVLGHVSFNIANVALIEILAATGRDEINDLYLLIPSLLAVGAGIVLMKKHTNAAVLIQESEATIKNEN